MLTSPTPQRKRAPRFRRLTEPRPFQLTDGDVAIIRAIARHRFIRSRQIAVLVGRSLDRVNDRLSHLFHAGYVDRPRAQLDRFPTDGSSHMVYALADGGARLLHDIDGAPTRRDLSERNHAAMRPFIEHQLGIVDFHVAMQSAADARRDVALIHPEQLIADFPAATRADKNPLKLAGSLSEGGRMHEFGIVPDLLLGLRFADKSRRCFTVEIDRGTMPVIRTDPSVTSYSMKMRSYLATYAAGLHERRYGWKAFRVLTVTTDKKRVRSMIDALASTPMPSGPGASLFFFTTREEIAAGDPLALQWLDGRGRPTSLL